MTKKLTKRQLGALRSHLTRRLEDIGRTKSPEKLARLKASAKSLRRRIASAEAATESTPRDVPVNGHERTLDPQPGLPVQVEVTVQEAELLRTVREMDALQLRLRAATERIQNLIREIVGEDA